MQIIKSEKIQLTSEEWDILNKIVPLLDDIYQNADNHEICSSAELARDGIIDLVEYHCE